MKTILGIDDAVNTCDCCGKTNLKSTVIVDVDGEILHYGSVCATRHTGKTGGEIKRDIDQRQVANVNDARAELGRAQEVIELEAKRNAARKAGLIGVKFMQFCKPEQEAFDVVREAIAAKYDVATYKLF